MVNCLYSTAFQSKLALETKTFEVVMKKKAVIPLVNN